MIKYIHFFFFIFIIFQTSFSQEQEEEIDASKPTNFYSFIDNTLEYQFRPKGGNVMGYRGNVTLAPSEKHLILGEIPLLYNDSTNHFGVGDVRLRYFYLPYKNYDKFFGAFGPSIDVFVPTSDAKNGIGSGRWIVSPGLMGALMIADWIQMFPVLSYQYISKSNSSILPDSLNRESHGITFQVIMPVVFGEKFFMTLTPIFQMNDLGDIRRDRYVQEILFQYALKPKLQLSAFGSGNFTDNLYVARVGLVVYF